MNNYFVKITDYLWSQSWQLALLIAVIAVVSWAVKNRSAHVRYLLWLIVLAKCLVPPFLAVPIAILPQEKSIKRLPPSSITESAVMFETSEVRKRTSTAAPIESGEKNTAQLKADRRVIPSIRQIVGATWIVGMVVFGCVAIARAIQSNLRLRLQRRSPPNALRTSVEELFSGFGVKVYPKVWLLDGIGQPFVWGLLRGSIYLPIDYLKIHNAAHRRDILGHELCHILRLDAAINLLQIVAQAIFWFHPLIWWANQKIRMEREQCCDEMAVAKLGTKVKEYSAAIIKTLISEHESIRPVPSLAVAGPVKDIEERIKNMLRPGKKFYKHPSLIAATTILLAALLTVPTALVLTARAGTKAAPTPLHQAVADGNIRQVKSLVSKGADVNAMDKNNWTPLHSAAYYALKDVVEVLLAKGANVNATDVSGRTPLHLAVEFGAKYVPELLLAKGANVNARDKAGNTPLHYAAGREEVQKSLLELLLTEGADINTRNDQGETPLHHAAPWDGQRKRLKVAANVFLTHGANVNAKDNAGCTPLYMAARNGREDIVKLLLSKGANINEKNNEGMTALHIASTVKHWKDVGHNDVVELLLNEGADANAAQWSGWTALHFAAGAGIYNRVKLLISKGADVNPKNNRGETPAHLALVRNHKGIVKLLISKGAEVSTIQMAAYIGNLTKVKNFIEKGVSVNEQDGYWLTPLHAAAATGKKEVIEFLISKGASVNTGAVVQGPGTPLHYAIDGGSKEVAELLVSKGAPVHRRNMDEETPLHLAARKGYNGLVKLLLARGSYVNTKTGETPYVNAKDKEGETALHYAAQNGHTEVVVLLIDNGADIHAEDNQKKWTPFHYAAANGHKDVAQLLIDKGADVKPPLQGLLSDVCWSGHRDVTEFLIQKGAKINRDESYYWAASHSAVFKDHTDVVELLLAHGADPDAKDRWAWSNLHYASDSADITKLLLDKGADPDVVERERGQTPLHLSSAEGQKAVVKLLISHGADVNIKDYDGRTPLLLAKNRGRAEIVELLREHGAKE